MATTQPFVIDRLTLTHYRSIAKCELELGPLAILVGPNGSGKSNVVDSLRFVSQALRENLDNALRQRGGVDEVRRRSNGHPHNFSIGLRAHCADVGMEYGFSIGSRKDGGYEVTKENALVRSSEFGSSDVFFRTERGELVESSDLAIAPRIRSDVLALAAFSATDAFRPLFDGLSAMEVFNPNPEAMRGANTPDPGDTLFRDAANIASVIGALERSNPEAKRTIEEYLSHIVPGVSSIRRKAAGPWETLEFRQAVSGSPKPWRFDATSMSDGTLRALGVLTAMLAVDDEHPSPIAIEEPETALHPAAAGVLMESLRAASEDRQLLVTTHSPDLLDAAEISPTEVYAVRSVAGTTRIAHPDSVGMRALRENLFSPGDLLRTDQLQPEDSEQPELMNG